MRDTGLTLKKAEALYAAYRKGLAQGRFRTMYEAGAYCVGQTAPSFFISAKRASILVGRLIAGQELKGLNPALHRMAERLKSDYDAYLAEHPGSTISRERIMEMLVDRSAPEFYISAEHARKMLRQEIRKARRRLGWYD